MRVFGANPDRKPRLKPGFTFTRLVVFLVAAAVFAVLAEHFASGTYPPSFDCGAKGIDPKAHNVGSCTNGSTTLVVVDKHETLKLKSLEARLLKIRERRTIAGPGGSKTARGKFLTFELAITNRTGEPAPITAGQFLLVLGGLYSQDLEIEEGFERRSFLAGQREIPPHGTEDGTVTFAVPVKRAPALAKEGNLDLVNLGSSVPALEPEALYYESEYGVIRTYR